MNKNIRTKQFEILTDINMIWDFMVDIYGRGFTNGVAAPFYEYAICSSWMDTTYQYLNRIWLDGDKVVAFVFNESPITDIYFSLRPGYEFLVDEMMDYAEEYMPNFENKQQFVIFKKQTAFIDAIQKRNYQKVYEQDDLIFDFKNELHYQLPEGFHLVDRAEADAVKLAKCFWQGFNHDKNEGPFINWDQQGESDKWTPHRGFKGVQRDCMCPSPHSTFQYGVIIANEKEEYVCYSGMWWVPQNKLAYMEPLCTIPEYRNRGLAAAALSIHYERMKALGADHMTGGDNGFYRKIGYTDGMVWTFWKKQ